MSRLLRRKGRDFWAVLQPISRRPSLFTFGETGGNAAEVWGLQSHGVWGQRWRYKHSKTRTVGEELPTMPHWKQCPPVSPVFCCFSVEQLQNKVKQISTRRRQWSRRRRRWLEAPGVGQSEEEEEEEVVGSCKVRQTAGGVMGGPLLHLRVEKARMNHHSSHTGQSCCWTSSGPWSHWFPEKAGLAVCRS